MSLLDSRAKPGNFLDRIAEVEDRVRRLERYSGLGSTVVLSGDVRIGGGLVVGSTDFDPASGHVVSRHLARATMHAMPMGCNTRLMGPIARQGSTLYVLPSDAGTGAAGGGFSQEYDSNTYVWYGLFNGVDQYWYWADNYLVDPRYNFTFLTWVKFNDPELPGGEAIAAKWYTATTWRLLRLSDSDGRTLRFQTSIDGSALRTLDSTDALDAGTWYFVSCAYNSNSGMTLVLGDPTTGTFKNWSLTTATGVLYNNSHNFAIGARSDGGANFLDGRIAIPFALLGSSMPVGWLREYYNLTRILFR
jgi:hypothetical protein